MTRPRGAGGARTTAPGRRTWLARSASLLAVAAGSIRVPATAAAGVDEAVSRHFPFGVVAPARRLPDVPLALADGRATTLAALTRGRVTALQLMFAGCSAICPLQGALFQQIQAQARERGVALQFLSISIDPLNDTPAALAAWLARFGALPGWLAAAPRLEDLAGLSDVLAAGGEKPDKASDPHTGQVYLVDARALLVFRTPSMPSPERVLDLVQQVRDGR